MQPQQANRHRKELERPRGIRAILVWRRCISIWPLSLDCSSRPGGFPANLQGIWAEEIHTAMEQVIGTWT